MESKSSTEPLMSGLEDGWNDVDQDHVTQVREVQQKNKRLKATFIYAFIALPWLLLVVLGIKAQYSLDQCKSRYYIRPDLVYSPLQDLVRYETKIFTTGLPGDTDYSPYAGEPSDAVDEVWTDLYPSLHQLIPEEQAAKLVNGTVLYPHDEERRYVIEINVFHDLHCLNMIRKATRPDYYKPEGETENTLLSQSHITHCIDAIRQTIMCASDITPYTWKWNPELGINANNVKNPHTCRNFDVLRDWARVNTNQEYFDAKVRVANDPLDPSTWLDGFNGK